MSDYFYPISRFVLDAATEYSPSLWFVAHGLANEDNQ